MNLLTALILGAISGLIGAFAMNFFMRAVSSQFSQQVDMLVALGSYFTGKIDNAAKVGTLLHGASGLIFGMLYLAIMQIMGATFFPYAIFLGMGFGLFHGLLMSYLLMFYASEKHPIETYRKATMATGLLHLVGHVIFGAVTGLIGALASLAM